MAAANRKSTTVLGRRGDYCALPTVCRRGISSWLHADRDASGDGHHAGDDGRGGDAVCQYQQQRAKSPGDDGDVWPIAARAKCVAAGFAGGDLSRADMATAGVEPRLHRDYRREVSRKGLRPKLLDVDPLTQCPMRARTCRFDEQSGNRPSRRRRFRVAICRSRILPGQRTAGLRGF